MAKKPTKSEIQLWIPAATDIFKSIMLPINVPYPQVIIANGRNFRTVRAQLVSDLACKNIEYPEDSIMEYIHGEKGNAILIRQNLLPDSNDEHFCWFFWHELGHFYAINSEKTNLHRYSDPELVDDSHIVEFTTHGPVLGLSDERLKQEGYWFWQEFIAEAISKYISFKHRSTTRYYHPELMECILNTGDRLWIGCCIISMTPFGITLPQLTNTLLLTTLRIFSWMTLSCCM